MTAGDVGEIGACLSARGGAADRVARDAWLAEEDIAPAQLLGIAGLRRSLELGLAPSLECLRRLRDHEHGHVGMLKPAEFRALAAVDAFARRRKDQRVVTAWDQILLPGKARYPEAVDDVVGAERHPHAPPHGNVDFICTGENALWLCVLVAQLAPPVTGGEM